MSDTHVFHPPPPPPTEADEEPGVIDYRDMLPVLDGRVVDHETLAANLREAYKLYSAHCLANPMPIGNRGRTVPQPQTKYSFLAFVRKTDSAWRSWERTTGPVKDAVEMIAMEIRAALERGGLTKTLDSNLVARIAKIADKQEIETTEGDNTQYDYSLLTDDELNQLEKLLAKCKISE